MRPSMLNKENRIERSSIPENGRRRLGLFQEFRPISLACRCSVAFFFLFSPFLLPFDAHTALTAAESGLPLGDIPE